MKYLFCLIALTILRFSLTAAPNFPFPQNVKYKYGIMPTNVDASKVQEAFEDFMKLYEESPDKSMARIKWDTEKYTVSEGIGYGMMILAYMDNASNNTQAKFDKLWKYYNNFLDPKGLMHWKIEGYTGPTGFNDKNSATDAELDVAVGLMAAYKQWGEKRYLDDATALIAKIAKEEVTSEGYLSPGDSWGASPIQYNPSYFSTGALQLFKHVSNFDWDKVIANSYDMIKKSRNAATGLPPDWCRKDGTPVSSVYKYDAARVPWRLGWAYCWYGHEDAKNICTKIAAWISTKTGGDASKVVDGYNLDGSEIGKYNNATFVGPFACAGLVDAAHQGWLDNAYARLNKLVETDDVYYQQSIKVITLLLLSGNMPDLWATTNVEPPGKPAEKRANSVSLSSNAAAFTELAFSTTAGGYVTITVHTLAGKVAARPVAGHFTAGNHRVVVANRLPSGTCIVRMNTDSGEFVKRVTVAR